MQYVAIDLHFSVSSVMQHQGLFKLVHMHNTFSEDLIFLSTGPGHKKGPKNGRLLDKQIDKPNTVLLLHEYHGFSI